MIRNSIWWWGSSSGDLGSGEYTFMALSHMSISSCNDGIYNGSIYKSNRSVWKSFCVVSWEIIFKQVLKLPVRVGEMAMNRYFTFPRYSELEPHHHMRFNVIPSTPLFFFWWVGGLSQYIISSLRNGIILQLSYITSLGILQSINDCYSLSQIYLS